MYRLSVYLTERKRPCALVLLLLRKKLLLTRYLTIADDVVGLVHGIAPMVPARVELTQLELVQLELA